jgi:hypothetical protein
METWISFVNVETEEHSVDTHTFIIQDEKVETHVVCLPES